MNNKKRMISPLTKCLLAMTWLWMVLLMTRPAFAVSGAYQNPDTGYRAYVVDERDLLRESEMEKVIESMKPITEYGDVVFYSCWYENPYSNLIQSVYPDYDEGAASLSVAERLETQMFASSDSYCMLVIEMRTRDLGVFVGGKIGEQVSKSRCTTIADNIYRLAGKADYEGCGTKAFGQLLASIKGQKIAEPMKVASNVLLALILALLINYFLVRILHGNISKGQPTILDNYGNQFAIMPRTPLVMSTSRKYSPTKNSHHSGGRSGGGGFSGGGGHGGHHHF